MALTQDALRFLYSTTGRHGRMVLDLGHPLPRMVLNELRPTRYREVVLTGRRYDCCC